MKTFYRDVLGLRTTFEDDVSAVFELGGTMLNVLAIGAAAEVVAPARPAVVGHTPRMLLTGAVWEIAQDIADEGRRPSSEGHVPASARVQAEPRLR